MTDSFVTRCPYCSTRLRVTHEQISIASGVVRCGTCLQTFNAKKHLLSSAASSVVEMDELLIHDDLDLHDLGLDDLDLGEELAKIEVQEQAFSKELLDLSQKILGNDGARQTQQDESWAEALLREEEGEESIPAAPSETLSPPPAPLSLSLVDDALPSTGSLWLPYKESPDVVRTPEASKPAVNAYNGALQKTSRKQAGFENKNKEDLNDFIEVADEPFERLQAAPSLGKPRGGAILWGFLSLLTLAVLAGQYVFFHFDSLSRQESMRPWLTELCRAIDCSLPAPMDISQIRSSNLVVHAHPELADALVVDAILYNRAAFAQPFPLLELEFSNMAGRPLVKRRFAPEQYLAGEMQGKRQMPPQIPIHIALEIQDPGADAVNYSLQVLAADF